jgi:hypothetical protein
MLTAPISNSLTSVLPVALLGLILAAAPTRAAMLVYEGFSYSSQADNSTLNGSGGAGLSGTWTGSGTYRTSGLSFSDLPVSSGSGCAEVNAPAGLIAASRQINVNHTGTLWGSFLFQSISALDGTSKVADLYVRKNATATDYDANVNFGVAPKRYGASTCDIRVGGYTNPPSISPNSGGTALSQNTTYLILYKVANLIAPGGAAASQTISSWMLSAAQYDNFKSGGLTEAELNAANQGSGSANVMQRTTLTATQKASFSSSDHLQFLAYEGGVYQYDEVRISNGSLNEAATLIPVPAAPGGLAAVPTPGLVVLTWKPVPGASGYNVKRSEASGAKLLLATTAATRYLDSPVTVGTTYYYVVSATTGWGESDDSSEISVTPTAEKANQTLTFNLGLMLAKTVGDDPFADIATASSGLTVTYSSDNTDVATVASNGTVTLTGIGAAHILADQTGDANWHAAPQLSQQLTVVMADPNLSFASLLDEMIHRDNLTRFPTYDLCASSSHDQHSDVGPSTVDWSAWYANNIDGSYYHGSHNGETSGEKILLSDVGAGTITRMWTAADKLNADSLRFYIDGSTTPVSVLKGTAPAVIGSNASFGSPLSSTMPGWGNGAQCYVLYAPISYGKSIVVTYAGTSNFWYNIDYRKYPPDTAVTSFSATTPAANIAKLASINAALADPASAPQNNTNAQTLTQSAILTHGQCVQALFNGGSGAVRKLQLILDAANMSDALQNCLVEIRCDQQKTVAVPVGAFFGTGPEKLNPVKDYYRTVDPATQTLTCYWSIPYQYAADFRVVNNSTTQQVTATLSAVKGDYAWTNKSMHFHANYRAENHITAGGQGGGAWSGGRNQDWNFLRVKGQGIYVGDTLVVTKPLGGTSAWWGEGDEKIWVDDTPAGGSIMPRIFGTGTEDYYNYSWGVATAFSHPFCGQPQGNANAGVGTTVNSRLNALDAIPFKHSLQRDQEIQAWGDEWLDYKAATFWYGVPGAAAWKTIANARDGVDRAIDGTTYSGSGQWRWLASNQIHTNTSSGQGTAWDDLTALSVGNAGNSGLGTAKDQNGQPIGSVAWNLPAISSKAVVAESAFIRNGDVSMHPGGTFQGKDLYPYVIARWIAGAESAGPIDIHGSIRELTAGGFDSVDCHILVDGVERYFVAGSPGAGVLPESFFDVETTVQAGSIVDFVVGNNGTISGDSAVLRATISVLDGIGEAATLSAYQQWKAGHGLTPDAAADGDPDADGIPTLVEYALALDPTISNSLPVTATFSGHQLTLSARKNAAATDVVWDAEVSADLVHWSPGTITLNTSTHFEASDTPPLSEVSRKFIRLKITLR